MARRKKYAIGDVFEIPLDDSGNKGYIRFKGIYDPKLYPRLEAVLIEAFKVDPSKTIASVGELEGLETLFYVRVITDILNNCQWKHVGNLPVSEDFVLPDMFTTDMFSGKYYLLKKDCRIEIDASQSSNYIFSGYLGYIGVIKMYEQKLKDCGLL